MIALSCSVAPLTHARLADARDIPAAVQAIAGPRGLGRAAPPGAAGTLGLVGAALAEALQSVVELNGAQDPDRAGVELWVEPTLMIVVVRFAGPPLPEWLVANWDRGEAPRRPRTGGWGWLTVREAMHGASQQRGRGHNLLFLEIRL